MRGPKRREFMLSPSMRGEIVKVVDERIRDVQVTREDFTELKGKERDLDIKLGELAEAQKRTEVRVEEIAEAQEKLAETQKRTEARVEELAEAQRRTEAKVEELAEAHKKLAEAQKRTEVWMEELAEAQRRMEARVEELAEAHAKLAEAQKRTEARVEELAEAQRRTEARLEELAEAQRRTELELWKLICEHRETRRQLGGLAMSVGYTLENAAYRGLPELLEKDFGIELEDRLMRQHVRVAEDNYIEVNIIGRVKRDGQRLMIGEDCKSQFSKNDADDFVNRKMELLRKVFEEIFPLGLVHMISISAPDAEGYGRQKDIVVYYSYDL